MSHEIEIELPPGSGGLTPNVRLRYRSTNGYGFLGVGWGLDLGSVERSLKGGVNYSADNFMLRFDGGASDLVFAGIDNGAFREYSAKIESDFKRVRKLTAVDGRPYFEVTDSVGTRYLYGQTAASRQDDAADSARIYKWCLDTVIDTSGNSWRANYFKADGAIYLDEIQYGGISVTFRREDNWWYATTSFLLNFATLTRYVLDAIEVRAQGKVVQAYDLGYDTSTATFRRRFTRLTQYAADYSYSPLRGISGTSLPSTSLSWTTSSGYDPFLWSTSLGPWGEDKFQGRIRPMDVNGDGKTDLVVGPAGGQFSVLVSNGSSFVPAGAPSPATPLDTAWDGDQHQVRIRPMDVNGDGKTDLVIGPSGGKFSVLLSDGGQFVSAGAPSPATGVSTVWDGNQFQGRIRPMDVNGDGKTDLVLGPAGGQFTVLVSNGSSFVPAGAPTPATPLDTAWDGDQHQVRIRPMDVNGDGKTDLVIGPAGGKFSVLLSDGSQFVSAGAPSPATGVPPVWDGNQFQGRIRSMDVNGDGKSDLVIGPSGGRFTRLISNGASFGSAGIPTPETALDPIWDGDQYQARIRPIDVNGDGKTDLVVGPTGGQFKVILSAADQFTGPVAPSPTPALPIIWDDDSHQSRVRPMDVNGDGLLDFVVGPDAVGAFRVAASRAPFPDLLSGLSNGIGGSVSVAYESSTAGSHKQLPLSVQMVKSVTTTDGNGNSSVSTYSYQGGYYHIGESEFRGFNFVRVTGQAGPGGEQAEVRYWFHQGNDAGVPVAQTTTYAPMEDEPIGTEGNMKGRVYRQQRWDLQKLVYAETLTSYSPDSVAPFFNPIAEVTTSACEYTGGMSVCGRKTKTTYGHDSHGNITREDHYGDVSSTTDDYTVLRTFSPNISAWIVSRPGSEVVYHGAGATTPLASDQVAGSSTYYDGSTNSGTCEPTGYSQTPMLGRPTRVVRWLNGQPALPEQPELWMGFDTFGNVTCVSDPDRRVTQFSYDVTGTFRTQVKNGLSQLLTTTYYGVGGVPAYGDSACPTTSLSCGLHGQVKSIIDPNQATREVTYDLFGRKLKETLPDNTYSTWAYTLGGVGVNRVETTHSAGAWTATYFDGLGRSYWTRQKRSATGRVLAVVTKFNASGTVAKTSTTYLDTTGALPADGALRWTNNTYDSLGRITQTTKPDATRTLACYRDFDGSIATIDANNHRRREERDAAGNRVRVHEYRGVFTVCTTDLQTPYATTQYEYDELSRPTAVVDAAGTRFETAYDTLGRKISQSDPDLGNWSYGYYNSNEVKWQLDAKGNQIDFEYDALARLKTKSYPNGERVTYTYDDPAVPYSLGRLTSMSDSSGETVYQYDAMGRVTGQSQKIDESWYSTSRAFDAAGRLSAITYPDNSVAAYQYDADGHLCKVSNSTADVGCVPSANSFAVFAGYNELDQVATTLYGNGVTTTYAYYDATSRLLRSIVAGSANGGVLSLGYVYDSVGNVKEVSDQIDSNRTQSFDYDELNRLTSASSVGYGTLGYSYSVIGNLLSKEGVTYTQYDPIKVHAVRATSDGRSYTYDLNGNMETETGSTPRTLTYDYENRPTEITAGGVTTFLNYDGVGQRVKKRGSLGATVYAGKLYECSSGACTAHVYAGNQLIVSVTGTAMRYYHADHLGSTRAVTDESGVPVETLFYRPFGALAADSSPGSSRRKFTGQEYDSQTGLYYYNARYYNPSLGRFVSADAVVPGAGNPQAFNRYSYVLNNPVRYRDPSGREPMSITAIIELGCAAGPWGCAGGALAAGGVLLYQSGVLKNVDLKQAGNWAGAQIRSAADGVGNAGRAAGGALGGIVGNMGGGGSEAATSSAAWPASYSPQPILYSSEPTGPTLQSESPVLQSVKFDTGPYGSVTSVIYSNGEVRAYPSQTWGVSAYDRKSRVEALPGAYEYRFGQHPMFPGPDTVPYPALNLYTLGDGGRNLPGMRFDGREPIVSGANFHMGYGYMRGTPSGSAGCHVVPVESWNGFIGNFRNGDIGLYYYFDLTRGGP